MTILFPIFRKCTLGKVMKYFPYTVIVYLSFRNAFHVMTIEQITQHSMVI